VAHLENKYAGQTMPNIKKNQLAVPVTDRNNKNRRMPLVKHILPPLSLLTCSKIENFILIYCR
jgi:hypothetical protein